MNKPMTPSSTTSTTTTSVASEPMVNPTIWTSYKSEVFRWRKHRFFSTLILFPALLGLLFSVLFFLLARGGASGIPNINIPTLYDVGQEGGYSFSALIFLEQIAGVFPLIIVGACVWSVTSEYNWRTIKMIATRQPDRWRIVLGKALFSLTVVAALCLSFLIGWIIYANMVKLAYGDSLTLATYDVDSILKTLKFFTLWCFGLFVWTLLALALAFQSKAITATLIGAALYANVDSILSQIGATAANLGKAYFQGMPGWVQKIVEIVRFIHPALLNTNLNRITGRPDSVLVNMSLPVWWSVLVIALYIVGFIGLSMLILGRRDITE